MEAVWEGGVLLQLPIRVGVGLDSSPLSLLVEAVWKGGVLLLLPIRVGEGEGLLPPFLGQPAQKGRAWPLPQVPPPLGLLYKQPQAPRV